MTRLLPALLLAASLAPSSALRAQTAPQPRAALVQRMDSLVNNYFASGPTASVAIAVVRGTDTVVMSARGLAELNPLRPANATTIYRIGSLTKQFTAAMILQLAEQRKLSIDDSIGRYLPTVPATWRPIVIRRLLNHTSGIHNYTDVPAWRGSWGDDLTPQQIIEFVTQLPLDFAPGSAWSYSNTGYVVLGMIIEKVTGQPYAQAVQQRLFKPLGMTHSLYCPTTPSPESGIASGYTVTPSGVQPAPFLSMTHPHAAGALCSTVGDFVLWQRALASGRVVSPESYRQMTTPERLASGPPVTYGFGLNVGKLEGHTSIAHSGGVHGFVSFAAYFPDDTLNVVLFSNGPSPAFSRLVQLLQRAALGVPLSPPALALPRVVSLATTDRDRFVGMYDLQLSGGRALPFRVFVRDGALISQAEGQGEIPLRYLGNMVFGADFDPAVRITFVDEGGRITKLTLLQGGQTVDGPRRP